jgi:biopolymer transport protein ExbD
MGAFAARDPLRKLSTEMNITPLVDVMLVLLVIFMLAAPLPTRKLELLNAPPCRGGCPPLPDPVRLAVKRSGEIYWDGIAVNGAALAAHLAGVARDPHGRAVEIHAERSASYSMVIDVLAAARNAGVEHIGMAPARD